MVLFTPAIVEKGHTYFKFFLATWGFRNRNTSTWLVTFTCKLFCNFFDHAVGHIINELF